MPPFLPALQLADVHARLEAESDVSGRVVEPHGILLAVPRGPSLFRIYDGVPLLGYGLGEILIKALGAGREVDLRVHANNLPAMDLYFKLHKHLGGTLFADQFRTSFGFLFNTRNLTFLSKRLRDSRV